MWERVPDHLKGSEKRLLVDGTRLAESYRLCEAAGINREIARPKDMLSGDELAKFIGRNSTLINLARDLFVDTHRQVADKSYLFILADGEGRTLDVFATPEILEHCWGRGIRTGTSLREESCGTNAVALALRYRQPTLVRGGQHFCRLFNDWLCVAAPVISPKGQPAACVDVSTSARADLGFLLPVVKFLAKSIEGWLTGLLLQPPEVAAVLRNPALATSGPALWPDLTRQESIIACLRAQGFTEGEIASNLKISVNTVKSHLKSIYRKLEVTSRRELQEKLYRAFPELIPPLDHPKIHPI